MVFRKFYYIYIVLSFHNSRTGMTGNSTVDQIFIRKLRDIILSNIENENFGVKELAHQSGLSRYSLNRRLLAITKKTCNQFIRETRLLKAMELLQNETVTVSEIAYKVGFGSPAYFNKCFHSLYGFSPGKIKKGDISGRELTSLTESHPDEKGAKSRVRSFMIGIPGILVLILLAGLAGYLIISGSFKQDWTDDLAKSDGRISIAVMPFRNMTHDTTWNIWQEGIQIRLISFLANNRNFKVRQKEIINKLLGSDNPTNFAGISPDIARKVSQKTDAKIYVYGNIKQAGSIVSIDAELVVTRTGEVIKSFTREGAFREENIFKIIDTLSQQVLNFLIISKLQKENHTVGTRYVDFKYLLPNSAEEYRYYLYGSKALKKGDHDLAISWFLKALAIDSNDFAPMIGLSSAYGNSNRLEQSLQWVVKYYNKRHQWPVETQLNACWAYAYSFEAPEEGIKYLRQMEELAGDARMGYLLGYSYNKIKQYDKAIPEFEKYLAWSRKLGKEFLKYNWAYVHLGEAYHYTGQYKKERKLYREAEKHNPNLPDIIFEQAVLEVTENDQVEAKRYIEKFKAVYKEKYAASEAVVDENLARIYYQAGKMDMSEMYYRKAIASEPDVPARLNRFANFLIENNRNPGNEVSDLMDRAMELAPNKVDYYNFMNTKGWGYYKQARYDEALEILQKAWNDAPFKLYAIYTHLEEVKKAVSGQKPATKSAG